MSNIAIKVEQLSKKYTIGKSKETSLYHSIGNFFRGKKANYEDFWALKDISFEVKQGEVLGVIGKNGAGKSTLLKILSRITEPTSGRVEMNGRVTSLLEVGTGFHPELTGRENIFLNGSILGMKRQEIKNKFDEIVNFSGIEKFIDTPVKHYSSGMYVRLAFSVSAYLDSEVLVIDEVLAVGDKDFRNKCLRKIGSVNQSGRTVLLVSHNLNIVRQLCSDCILLEKGYITEKSTVKNCIDKYLNNLSFNNGNPQWKSTTNLQSLVLNDISIGLKDKKNQYRNFFSNDEKILLEVKFFLVSEVKDLKIGISLEDEFGTKIIETFHNDIEDKNFRIGQNIYLIELPSNIFNQGFYYISCRVGIHKVKWFLNLERILRFEVEFTIENSDRPNINKRNSLLAPMINWKSLT